MNCGFKNLNIDLMYALPGQSIEDWIETLNVAACQGVPSITTYPFRIKSRSKWDKAFAANRLDVDWNSELEAQMMAAGRLILEANGYTRNSVNWYVRDERFRFSQQTSKYRMMPMVGIDARPTHSLIVARRTTNTMSMTM